ncbi:ATP-binding protein [Candidatus Saccharibacteria bacterium]|nr:ATP-binding protein [Candidatus Saccharibacteria bacterium]
MKSLSLARPIVVMMVGTPGAGKSFFARQFGDIFGAPLISFDEIRHILFNDPQFTRDEETLIALVMRSQMKQLFKTGKTFIIDGGLNTRMARMAIEKLARENDYGTFTIWVQTDEDTAAYRSMKRHPKRAGDALNTPMSESVFMSLVKRINPPEEKEPHVVISGKHTFATQAKMVLRRIIVPREQPVAPPQTQRSISRS